MIPTAEHRVKLQVFEGPLDLLLFLIRKNELDIYDIPIESVTRQYVEVLRQMQELDLDLAGDFFVMAATLMEIKSRMLLPKDRRVLAPEGEDDEAPDPRWELVHQLVQYRRFKDAAAELGDLARNSQDLLDREAASRALEQRNRPLQNVAHLDLWVAFNAVLRRLAEKLVVGEIHDEVVTVADQMEWLLERLKREPSFVFSGLFPEGVSLRRLIATFLALLELARLHQLEISQQRDFGDIECRAPADAKGPAPGADLRVTESSTER